MQTYFRCSQKYCVIPLTFCRTLSWCLFSAPELRQYMIVDAMSCIIHVFFYITKLMYSIAQLIRRRVLRSWCIDDASLVLPCIVHLWCIKNRSRSCLYTSDTSWLVQCRSTSPDWFPRYTYKCRTTSPLLSLSPFSTLLHRKEAPAEKWGTRHLHEAPRLVGKSMDADNVGALVRGRSPFNSRCHRTLHIESDAWQDLSRRLHPFMYIDASVAIYQFSAPCQKQFSAPYLVQCTDAA